MKYQAEQNTLTVIIESDSEEQAKHTLKEIYGGDWTVFPAQERDMTD